AGAPEFSATAQERDADCKAAESVVFRCRCRDSSQLESGTTIIHSANGAATPATERSRERARKRLRAIHCKSLSAENFSRQDARNRTYQLNERRRDRNRQRWMHCAKMRLFKQNTA